MTSAPTPLLLIGIPCLNEEKAIGSVIDRLPQHIDGVGTIDVVVIDDGSSDRSASIAISKGAKVIKHGINQGVGVAFQTAVEYTILNGYDMMVWIDGDGQFDPANIPQLLTPILVQEAEMVTASRFTDPTLLPNMPRLKLHGNRAMSLLVSALTRQRFQDVSCGFRAFSREALLQLNLHGSFTYTQETFFDLTHKGLTISEIPLSVKYFEDRQSRVANNLLMYGLKTLSILSSAYRDRYPFRFYAILSALFIAIGTIPLGLLLETDLRGEPPTPLVWFGVFGGTCLVVGAALLATAFSAKMLARSRINHDRILYLLKREAWLKARQARGLPGW
ncbi:MAG: glycosyltransferase family 2 protein [Alphaproteobacteria bacterium]